MGQVLGFAHCKESPSTASTTPDSTDGGNDESDFPDLQTAQEFSEEEEEEGSVEWGTPRELTFSYITIGASPSSSPTSAEQSHRGRRDSQTRRPRGALPRPETCETFVPTLGDSLENIPSLCPSPEGEVALPTDSSPFSGWDAHVDSAREVGTTEASPCSSPPEPAAETEPTGIGRADSSREDLSSPAAGPCGGTDPSQCQVGTLLAFCQQPPPEEEQLGQRSRAEQTWDAPESQGAPSCSGPARGEVPTELQGASERQEKGIPMASTVGDLVYWRDTRKSALVFTALMVALLCLYHFSIISVASYVSLAALGITISLRVYSKVLQALRRGEGENPFQAQLDKDFGLSKEQLQRLTERITHHVSSGTKSLQRLFLVDDLVESLKFALLFYILTYVGAVFNGLTLLILGVISVFTFPLLYKQHQAQIDQYVGLVRNQLSNLRAKMLARLPTAKAKAE